MKAIQLQADKSLRCVEAPPPPAGPGEVPARVIACALCRTDAKMWRHGHRDLVVPRILGHEICVRSGEDRFVAWPGSCCLQCQECLSGSENLCAVMRILGFHRDGGLAEWVAVPESSLIPVPGSLSSEVACLAEPLGCALNALEGVDLAPGERVLIYGAGPVGLLLALAARSVGAAPLVIEIDPEKLALSTPFRRATGIAAETSPDASDFEVVVNAAPSWETLRDGLGRLRPRGRYAFFSGLPGGGSLDAGALNEIHYRQLRMVGAYGCTRRQMASALEVLRTHASEAALLIQERIRLDEVPASLERILDGRVLKTVVQVDR